MFMDVEYVHNWQFSFSRCHHQVEGHKGPILRRCLAANGLFIEVAKISFLGPFFVGAFSFLYQVLHIKEL
jgi:hypothetical protein